MISVLIFCGFTLALLWYVHARKSVAERVVDLLYGAASVSVAVAHSADVALTSYRNARAAWRSAHAPVYERRSIAEQAQGLS